MSKGRKVSKTVADVNWDEGLINAVVKDDCWTPYLVFLAPNSCHVEPHLQILVDTAVGGIRRKFTVIDRDAMLQSAREDVKLASATATGGGGRKSKQAATAPASKPQHVVVCEHVANAISTGGQVSPQLTARMLKYTVLRKRTLDIARREALTKEADETFKPQKAATDKSAKKAASGRASKAGKKGKETPSTEVTPEIPLPQKLGTTMRKRGEEDLDSKCIDDEPGNGPSCYFLLTGFTSAEIFQELSSVKLTPNALVKVIGKGVCAIQDTQSEDEQATLQQRNSHLSQFWSLVTNAIKDTPSGSMLRDLALLELPIVMIDMPSSDEAKRGYGQTLFDSLAQLIYSVLKLYKQYLHYLEYLDLRSLPEGTRSDGCSSVEAEVSDTQQSLHSLSNQLNDSSTLVDMRHYNMLLNVVPEECTSVTLILSCMLEQVSVSLSTTDASSNPHKATNMVHPSVVSEFDSCIAALALPTSEKKELLADQSTPKQTKDSCFTIAHGDLIKERTFHLKNSKHMNISESETNTNRLSNLMVVVNAPSIPAEESRKAGALLHSVEHFCASADMSPQMLKYALILLSLESITLPNASTAPSNLSWFGAGQFSASSHLLFDHPFLIPLIQKKKSSSPEDEAMVPYSEQACDFQSPPNEQVSASALESCETEATAFMLDLPKPLTHLHSYCTCEYLQKDALLQMLQELVHYTHPYIIPYYHKLSRSVVIVAHTGFDGKPIHKYGWSSQAHSKVGFQNYLKYVTKRYGDTVDQAVLEDAESWEQHERDRKLMIEEKLKALQEQQVDMSSKEEEPKPSAKGSKGGSATTNAKKTPSEKSPQGKRSKMSTKECTPTSSTHNIEASLPEFEKQKRFNAYDVGDIVLLNNGSITTQFIEDGTQIRTEKYQLGESQLSVKVSVFSNGNTVSAHLTKCTPNNSIANGEENAVPGSDTSSDKACGREDNSEPDDAAPSQSTAGIPEPPHSVAFASLQASFHNSLTLSVSHYGPKGSGKLPFKPKQPDILNEMNRSESTTDSRPQSRQGASPQKLSKKQLEQQQQLLEQQKLLEEQNAERKKAAMDKYLQQCNDLMRQNKYQQIFLSTPYGLQVHSQVMIDLQADPALTDGSDGYTVIRQSYPVKTSGTQLCEEFLLQSAYQEKHRSYLPDGSVVRFMLDKSVVIQCSDGSTYRTTSCSEVDQYAKALANSEPAQTTVKTPGATSAIPERIASAAKVSFADKEMEGSYSGCRLDQAVWVVTIPSGQQYLWKSRRDSVSAKPSKPETQVGDTGSSSRDLVKSESREELADKAGDVKDVDMEAEKIIPLKLMESFSSTDPVTKEVMISREDNVTLLHRPNGSLVVEHADGTRFTTKFNQSNEVPTEIIVECPGFARVIHNPVSHQCKLEFADSTEVICSTDGSYALSKPKAYKLDITYDGKAHYKPDITSLKSSYTLNYTGQGDLLVASDQLNNFSVNLQGEASTSATTVPSHQAFAPRYFVSHPDGTSYELLHRDSVKNIISEAEMNPKAVVLKQQEPDCTTIIEPCMTGLPVVPYIEGDIIPSNLRRKAESDALQQTGSPCKQNTSRRFGVGVGKALMIGSYERPSPPMQFTSPNALKYRQFVHLRPVKGTAKEQIFIGLTDFLVWYRKQEADADALIPEDSRKVDEVAAAHALQSKWNICEKPADPFDATVIANYANAASSIKNSKEDKPLIQTRRQVEFVKGELEETEAVKQALRNNRVPTYFQSEEYFTVQSPDMDALTSELAQSKKISKPLSTTTDEQQDSKYPHSGVSTPSTLQSTSGTMIAEREVVSPAHSELGPVSSLSKLRPSNPTPDHAHGKGTPTDLRPTNPTPSHAFKTNGNGPSASTSSEEIPNALIVTKTAAEPLTNSEDVATECSGLPQEVQAPPGPSGNPASSVSCLPKNGTSTDITNLQRTYETQGGISDNSSKFQTPEGGDAKQSSRKTNILLDVTGNPRQLPVILPFSVQGGRPGERSNTKFTTVEEPVRRKVHTSSIATAVIRRGFEVVPDEVEFGVLREGCTYGYTVTLRNTGVDSCRFKIKQPPPSTGIKVTYKPGPVAAGMSRAFEVEIFAMAVGAVGDCGEGLVQHDLEITSETSILYMPIKATVLTSAAYHNRLPTRSQGQEAAGVRTIANRPSSRNSVTRPPKTV